MSDGANACSFDGIAGVAECSYPDGVRQVMKLDPSGDIRIQTHSADADTACVDEVIKVPESQTGGAESGGGDGHGFVTVASAAGKHVKSWNVQVPAALGGDKIDEFVYFEKNGEPWKVEAYEKGKTDGPLVVDLGELDDAWASEGLSDTCEDPKRNLLEALGVHKEHGVTPRTAGHVALRGAGGRKLHPVFLLFKAGMFFLAFTLFCVWLSHVCRCRRQRLLLRSADALGKLAGGVGGVDPHAVAGVIASVAASAAAAAAVAGPAAIAA